MNDSAESTVIIEPRKGLFHLDLRAIWHYRELLYFLVWRDLKVRYKQTVIGIGWAVLQPVITMIIFTAVFGGLVKMPSDGLPYPIFFYSALLPWNYFAGALQRCVASVVGDAALVSKVYFPRLILPLAGTVSGLVDFAVSFVLLLGMIFWYEIGFSWAVLMLPLFLILALSTALVGGALAVRLERPLPRCRPYDSFPHSSLDVLFTDCVPRECCSHQVPLSL